MAPRELTVSEVAERLEISRSSVLRLLDGDELDARRRTRNGPWYISEESVQEFEDELDDEEDEDDDAYERGHSDGYKEALVECGDGDDDDDDEDDD